MDSRLGISRLLFQPLVFQPGLEFFADDGEMGRGFDADADASALNPNDGDGDLIADEQPLSNFAAKHQHVRTPLL
jgi:hypothetical protein